MVNFLIQEVNKPTTIKNRRLETKEKKRRRNEKKKKRKEKKRVIFFGVK